MYRLGAAILVLVVVSPLFLGQGGAEFGQLATVAEASSVHGACCFTTPFPWDACTVPCYPWFQGWDFLQTLSFWGSGFTLQPMLCGCGGVYDTVIYGCGGS